MSSEAEDLAGDCPVPLCSPHLLGEHWSTEHRAHRASRVWDVELHFNCKKLKTLLMLIVDVSSLHCLTVKSYG